MNTVPVTVLHDCLAPEGACCIEPEGFWFPEYLIPALVQILQTDLGTRLLFTSSRKNTCLSETTALINDHEKLHMLS